MNEFYNGFNLSSNGILALHEQNEALRKENEELRKQNERLIIALTPRRWDDEMSNAWYRTIPDANQAFNKLREVATKPPTTSEVK